MGRKNEINELEMLMQANQFTLTKYISSIDVKRAGLDWGAISQKEREQQLWDFGMDTKKYTFLAYKDEHRTLQGDAVRGIRYICQERTDKEWALGPHASQEAYLAFKRDPSLTMELRRMENNVSFNPENPYTLNLDASENFS